MKNKVLAGHLMTLLTMTIWGTTYISTKVLLQKLDPIEILICRFLIAYISLVIIYPRFKKPNSIKEELLFFSAGLSGVTMYFLLENIALRYTLASNVGLLISIAPILTAFLAHFFTKDEKFNRNLIFGFVIAIFGVFLVIFNGNFILKLNPLGDTLAVLAAVVWSVYSIVLKKLGSEYNYIYITRKIFFYGLITMIPALFIFKVQLSIQKLLDYSVLPNILFLGLAASSLCFIMWNSSVSLIGVVKASNYIYLVPVITISTAVFVLNEKVTSLAAIGAILILSGVYISEHGFLINKRNNGGPERNVTE